MNPAPETEHTDSATEQHTSTSLRAWVPMRTRGLLEAQTSAELDSLMATILDECQQRFEKEFDETLIRCIVSDELDELQRQGVLLLDGTTLTSTGHQDESGDATWNVLDDGSITKRIIVEGTGSMAKPGLLATVSIQTFVGEALVHSTDAESPQGFEFLVGAGKVIAGWDVAVATMNVGEKAEFFIQAEHAFREEGTDSVPPSAPIRCVIYLQSTVTNPALRVTAQEIWTMTGEEKLHHADAQKLKGNASFRAAEYERALEYYQDAMRFLNCTLERDSDVMGQVEAQRMKVQCNMVRCYHYMERYRDGRSLCIRMLTDLKRELTRLASEYVNTSKGATVEGSGPDSDSSSGPDAAGGQGGAEAAGLRVDTAGVGGTGPEIPEVVRDLLSLEQKALYLQARCEVEMGFIDEAYAHLKEAIQVGLQPGCTTDVATGRGLRQLRDRLVTARADRKAQRAQRAKKMFQTSRQPPAAEAADHRSDHRSKSEGGGQSPPVLAKDVSAGEGSSAVGVGRQLLEWGVSHWMWSLAAICLAPCGGLCCLTAAWWWDRRKQTDESIKSD